MAKLYIVKGIAGICESKALWRWTVGILTADESRTQTKRIHGILKLFYELLLSLLMMLLLKAMGKLTTKSHPAGSGLIYQ